MPATVTQAWCIELRSALSVQILFDSASIRSAAAIRVTSHAFDKGHVMLRLGKQPLTVPRPLDQLLLELVTTTKGKASLGHTDEHRWLFPGGLPGVALHPLVVSGRLAKLGIPGRIGRNTALMENAAALPAAVLSDLLGLSVSGAVQWTVLAGSTGNTYAADVARRSASGTSSIAAQGE